MLERCTPDTCSEVSESRIERQICRLVTSAGGLCLKFVSPGFVGVPDRLVLLPGTPAFFIEVKAPGKKPTSRQRFVHRRLSALGHRVFVVDNPRTAQFIIGVVYG